MALIAAHLNAEVMLVVTVYSDRYIISLFPHPLHNPFPPFSPSLISHTVSVDVKHHVYLSELRSCVKVEVASLERRRWTYQGRTDSGTKLTTRYPTDSSRCYCGTVLPRNSK